MKSNCKTGKGNMELQRRVIGVARLLPPPVLLLPAAAQELPAAAVAAWPASLPALPGSSGCPAAVSDTCGLCQWQGEGQQVAPWRWSWQLRTRRRVAHSMHWSSFPRFWFSTIAAISLALSSSICAPVEVHKRQQALWWRQRVRQESGGTKFQRAQTCLVPAMPSRHLLDLLRCQHSLGRTRCLRLGARHGAMSLLGAPGFL